ncbi:dUTP diphosphatase [Clostridium sp. CM028]|uniref:dUTP diphosphatase n=1 Tax=Clostridium TaxID=1485 RepID=UPI0013EEE63F|nr:MULTISPECIES: dUTP diphosphatase [Clostridium]MBU3091072.1 dUTP diphosphatase [Clostridium sp. CF011]MBW9144947.1 dUTP diphosphatase [Clostridium sp. CM027]MBW9148634.1 dUTP diphosphatase [Clostridium sp. CM028]MBZ9609683.1 dUTP diphosphatase [Clostridium estertheticum]UVE40085.1 dUTP diphosphatase [Clostridium sp. CM027]
MNLQKLFQMQNTLDHRIQVQHNLEGVPLLQKKILSLQVELGELANETRCFKFWSTKKPSSNDVILEEYVDCIHFILSLGIEKNFQDITLNTKCITSELSQQFLTVYTNISDFIICSSLDNYLNIFQNFLSLGQNLGFSEEDIENAYFYKNKINHERQDNGY